MKGFKKRLSTLTVCAFAVFLLIITASAAATEACPGGCSHQAAIGTTHYDTLAEAVTAAKSGSTVALLSDLTMDAPLTLDKSLALDLGGKTLTGSLHFTKGGTIRGGKLTAAAGTALTVTDCTVVIEKDAVLEGSGAASTVLLTASKDGKARLNVSGTVSGKGPAAVIDVKSQEGSCELYVLKNARITAEQNTAIAFDSAGKLDISGGTMQAKKDIVTVSVIEKRKTEIAVTGGKLLSREGEAILVTTDGKAEAPKDFITGGTYQKVPSAYIPAYCKLQSNNDGTTTVISSYTLTFQANGGSGTMDAVKVQCGSKIKLPKCSFKPAKNKEFTGWEIGGKTYDAGDAYTPDGDVTVTAQWKTHKHAGGKATCQKKAVCKTCGKSYGKLGSHQLTYVGAYDATCSASGMEAHHKCSTCGEYFADGVAVSADSLSKPALGHDWQPVDGIPATCEENGQKTHEKCSLCGILRAEGSTVTEEDLLIPAVGHTTEAVAASQATCTEPGIQAHDHCTACDQNFVNGTPVDLAAITSATSSHVLSDWVSDEHYHWKTCVDCQEVFRQKGHADADANGVCDDCGYTLPTEKEIPSGEDAGFSWPFLIPVIAAVAIAVPLALKKRK